MWLTRLHTTIAAIFMALFLHSSLAEFAEIPASVTVEIGGEPAIFRCRHMSVEATIGWIVNGSSVGLFPDIKPNIISENNVLVYTLSVPASLEYNETEVICEAFFRNGSPPESTPPATLILTESPSSTTSLTTTPSPTTPPTTTPSSTTQPATTPSSTTQPATTDVLTTVAPTTGPGKFELTPSPLTVAIEQGRAIFKCRHSHCVFVNWLVNKTSISRLSNVTQDEDNMLTSFLSFESLDGYNQSEVQCLATCTSLDGITALLTEPATLLIQGTPERVQNASCERNYSSRSLITTWNPLFSLDINGTDPDIVYTVEVFKITCGNNSLMHRTAAMEGSSTLEGLDMMQIYRAVIAAKNNVPEADVGESVPTDDETFMLLRGFTLFSLVRNSQVTLQSPDPVPSYYTMSLESLDDRGQDLSTNISVERIGVTINMNMSEYRLPSKSLWKVIVQAYGCEEHREETEISTHDIQNVTVTTNSSLPGQIRIKGDFVDESTANGVFVIIYSLTDYSDVHYMAKQVEETIDMNIMDLPGTEYNVSVFPLENGLPFERVVTSTKKVNVTTNGDQGSAGSPLPIEFKLQPSTNGVCITCNFMDQDSTVTNCLVVVHQRISQLISSGLMNIVSSHKFNRSGGTAYGCIKGVKLEEYQLGVVGGKRVIPSFIPSTVPTVAGVSNSIATGAAVGTSLAIILLVVLIAVVVVMLVIVSWRRRKISSDGYRQRSGGVTYAEVVLRPSRHNQLPTDPEKVVYDDPQKYLNPAGQTAQGKLPSVNTLLGDWYTVEYSEVIPHTKTVVQSEAPNTVPTPEKPKAPDPPADPSPGPGTEPEQEPFTVEVVFRRLHPYASKWKSLADALSFDDELVDEIFTNDEIDEPCLRVMIEMYLQRSYPKPSWEAIDAALEKVLNQPTEDASTSVQETNSSSNSQVVNGSSEFPPENHSSAEARKSFPVPGTTDGAVPSMASVEQAKPDKEEDAADTFVSQPDLQSAQSSESGSDNSQLCLVHTSKPSNGDPSTMDQLRTLPVSCFPALEPVSGNDYTTIQPFSTVCSEGQEEDLLCQPGPIHCQESDEEEIDYATALKQLLGISQELPAAYSSVNVERPVLARVKDEKPAPLPWNCINLNKSNVGEPAHALGRVLECIK